MVTNFPFEEKLIDGFYIRTFSSNLNEMELKWHFDEQDRVIVCEEDTDWLFQMDNELPIKIEKNVPIFIPEGQFHRIIKGKNDLVLKIKKFYDFDNTFIKNKRQS